MRYRVLLRPGANGTVMSGIATYLRRATGGMERAAKLAEGASAEEALAILKQLSSGPYSAARLAQLGHPYRIGGSPPQDPAIINRQTPRTGEGFRDAWRIEPTRKRGEGLSTRIVNTKPYAAFLLGGTSKMIPRPILGRMQERLRPARQRLWREALAKRLASG